MCTPTSWSRRRRVLFLVCLLLGVACQAQGATLTVPAGGDLQAALYAAQAGDVIELPAGVTFVGQFVFPAKTGTVTLRTAGTLPDARVTPFAAPLLATIASPVGAMPVDLTDSANWTLDGIRFEPNPGGFGEVITIQRGLNITLRRLLFVVPPGAQQKRFILGNGRSITLTQSHCQGVWRTGQDSQCFAAWDGAGPYTIYDNYLEAASENVMFGGADSSSPANIPSDILVEGNLFTKDLAWQGQPRNVKNLFELKAAKRVVIRNNVFERNWADGQSGRAILFTPRNQDGTAPWSVVEDVLFEQNIVRDVPMAFGILGQDDIYPSLQTERIVIRENVIETTQGMGIMALNEVGRLEFYRNTLIVPLGAILLYVSDEGHIATVSGGRNSTYAVRELVWAENITPNGYIHAPTARDEAALALHCESYWLTLTAPQPQPIPPPDPVLSPAQIIDQSIALLSPLESQLKGKALTNLRNILTRLRTLKGQVQ